VQGFCEFFVYIGFGDCVQIICIWSLVDEWTTVQSLTSHSTHVISRARTRRTGWFTSLLQHTVNMVFLLTADFTYDLGLWVYSRPPTYRAWLTPGFYGGPTSRVRTNWVQESSSSSSSSYRICIAPITEKKNIGASKN